MRENITIKKHVLSFWVEERLRRENRLCILGWGRSMSPFIREGDLIEVVPCHLSSRIRIGDIILARSSYSVSGLIMHRVIKKLKENGRTIFVTQGDIAPYPDSPIYLEDVLGKVISVERNGMKIRLSHGLYHVLGFCLLCSIPLRKVINHRIFRRSAAFLLSILRLSLY